MKKTFEQLDEFLYHAEIYLKSIGNNKNKLSYAIERITPSLKQAFSIRTEKLNDFRIECASVDEKGNLILNEGQKGEDRYSFTPDKLKSLNKKARDLNKEEVDIKTYYATVIPNDLSFLQVEAFRGIIIPEDYQIIESEETR